MSINEKVFAINSVIHEFFQKNPRENKVPAKDLMPYFIKSGIFISDHKNGLPIRKILRTLDQSEELKAIPFAFPERKVANTNWYFVRSSKFTRKGINKPEKTIEKAAPIKSREDSDEAYVLDLCDEILGKNASRQHKFEFLRGDTGRKLPVDAYYENPGLAIEYRERQHSEAVSHFDKPNKTTVSGVHRGDQRKIYDQRRRDLLPKNGIQLIEIDYIEFLIDGRKQILRDRQRDLDIVRRKLIKNL